MTDPEEAARREQHPAAPRVRQQWNVTVKGQPGAKLVTGERVDVTAEWVTFIDSDGHVVLLVHESDLLLVEQYVEPFF